ncbi:Hypothetical protein (Fragment), partial [Durusdinium trenchii]
MAEMTGGTDARAKVRESMKLLLQKGSSSVAKPATSKPTSLVEAGHAARDFGYSKFEHIGREEEAAEALDAAQRNEEFFKQLEKDYGQMCRQDGWDEVLRASKEEPQLEAKVEEGGEKVHPKETYIPPDSDYHRVPSLPGGGRELRFDPERGRQLLAQLPQKPRRNLEALRKVEAETREAMEKERKRRAEMPASEPIRTTSDVVHLESLEDSE